MNTISLIGATLEKISVEIRHLQRTEVLEAEEYFSKGQKGSSAMPHKKNPIICERISFGKEPFNIFSCIRKKVRSEFTSNLFVTQEPFDYTLLIPAFFGNFQSQQGST